jgi:FtsP/CotA-like multicopper oxidase with cupredoxin domain
METLIIHLCIIQIHWHGMTERGTPWYDGLAGVTQCPIPPLSKMEYTFLAEPRGSSFWHAHFREQNEDGLYGALIVDDLPGSFPFDYDEEVIIMMTDAYNLNSEEVDASVIPQVIVAYKTGQPAYDPSPDQSLLCTYDETKDPPVPSCSSTTDGNGFNINFQPGKTYRLRLICSSEISPFAFSIDKHELQVVGADFSLVDGTTWVTSVPLMVGYSAFYLIIFSDQLLPRLVSDMMFWYVLRKMLIQEQNFGSEPLRIASVVSSIREQLRSFAHTLICS